jgi:hypothetical protein
MQFRRYLRFVLPLLFVCLLASCLPVAWVTPPMQMELGVGVGHRAPDGQVNLAAPLRAGIHPMQAFERLYARPVDVGVGYQLWLPPYLYHGPYLEVMHLIPTSEDPHRRSWRFGLGARGHYLFELDGMQRGPAVSVKAVAEWVEFAAGVDTTCSISAGPNVSGFCGNVLYYGETSLGFFLEATRGWSGEEDLAALTVGLTFRVPASAGAGFVFGLP